MSGDRLPVNRPVRLGPLQRLLGAALAMAMFGMMAVTFVDVVGRFLFASPIAGASELIQVLMAAVVAAALPLVTASRSHVTMSLFNQAIRGRPKFLLDASIMVFSAIVLGFVAVLLAMQGADLYRSRASSIYLDIPVAPVAWMLSVTVALACFLEFTALVYFLRRASASAPDRELTQ